MDENLLIALGETIENSHEVAALTGAGISVPSGIPDFRSEDGLWKRYNPEIYASYSHFLSDPSYFWEMHIEVMKMIDKSTPNPAHNVLAALENMGIVKGVITQNIDGLHQKAGSQTVLELHGTNETCSCTICQKTYATREIAERLFSWEKDELIKEMRRGKEIPMCDCGGWIKPDVVLFGELMPLNVFRAAEELAASCDVLLAVGSSLQVQPAASLPFTTKKRGGKFAIINREQGLLDWMADHLIVGLAEDALPRLLEQLEK